jgi:phosphoserine phosphatase RsbU/P
MEGDPRPQPLPAIDALYEQAPCGLLVTTRAGQILHANATFCRWIGMATEDLVGKRRLQDLLTMGGRIFHQTHWAPLMQIQGSIAEVKLDMVHASGHTLPMMLNAVRRGDDTQALHEIAVFIAEDRSKYEAELLRARKHAEELLVKERAAQEALRQAQAEIQRQHAAASDRALFAEQMVGIVSHDLRNPLSAILMSAHLLERGELTANQRTVLGRINNSTARAQRMIADLLDFTQARIGTGLSLTRSQMQLHQLVSDSLEELATAFPGRQISHVAEGTGECFADADRLIQLIGNLVSNAFAYGAPDRPVRVASTCTADGASIRVANDGEPIPPELLQTLFDPMVRGADGGGARSVGLGLFIVRAIARAHDGDVEVSSSLEDGTVFTVRMPQPRP